MNHDILEVPKVPRQRAELQTMLNESRYQRRRARLKRWITIIVVLVAIAMLAWRFSGVLFHSLPSRGSAVYYVGTVLL